jgi:hypothetical protein
MKLTSLSVPQGATGYRRLNAPSATTLKALIDTSIGSANLDDFQYSGRWHIFIQPEDTVTVYIATDGQPATTANSIFITGNSEGTNTLSIPGTNLTRVSIVSTGFFRVMLFVQEDN